ncbi:CDP-Glycerol:Poly(glycerophosphate) glycerophosphotransferase [uncultured archaeon]|nr:CDP-Glycerol:Poly(glycerophosphate) glycerophosphotransferase [uncultured archaeon]
MENETKQKPVFDSPNDAANWLAEIAMKRLSCGKNLLEASLYDGSPLWWAAHTELALYISGQLVDVEKRQKRHFAPEAAMWALELADQLGTTAIAKTIVALQFLKGKSAGNRKKVLFFTYEKGWRGIPDPKTGKMVEGDIHYRAVMDELLDCGYGVEVATVAPLWRIGFWTSANEALKRALMQKPLHLPLENFWDFGVYSRQKKAGAGFSAAWKEINSDEEFWKSFNAGGKDFREETRRMSEFFFVSHFRKVAKAVELFSRLIEREKPCVLVAPNHGGWYWKALLIAAKAKGVKVLSTQHAGITDDILSYFNYPPLTGKKLGVQLPDAFAAQGIWTCRLFEKTWGYPKSMLKVTGQPRYDFIPAAKKSFDRESCLKGMGISPEKKVVLFATQLAVPPFVDDERLIFRALAKIQRSSGIGIIVKPHPRGKAEDYEKIAKEEGADAVVIGENSVFHEAVLASDLVISLPSTIITEALMLCRPAMLVDFGEGNHKLPWVESGVAIPISEKDGIEKNIGLALFDGATRKRLDRAREKFVLEHCFLQDGKAAKRVAVLIMEMIEGNRQNWK